MTDTSKPPLFRPIALLTVAVLTILTLAGCGYFGYYTSRAHLHQTFEYLPSMSVLNRLSPEDSLVLRGRIITVQQMQESLFLVAVSNRFRQNEKVALVQLPQDGTYTVFLPQGEYDLYVFADLDRNRDFEWNEMVGHAKALVSAEHAKGGIVVEGPPVTVDLLHSGKVDFHLSETVRPTSYVFKSLDNEFFDPQYGNTGLYNPSELIAHNQGFFFGLQDYDAEKTTVLFVHGIAGTPRDWKYIVSGLDQSRFQPFFFYYPSGLPLDRLGALLAYYIESLDKATVNNGNRLVLVAHSMGGLVALSAIQKLDAAGLPLSLKLYCSFSTPYAGAESARKGLEVAPVVVPVWKDIAAGSAFIQDLSVRAFPRQLPFFLYFSYLDTSKFKLGESSDGSVTLRSQLLPSIQSEATRIIGFNETHEGILNSEAVRASFLKALDHAVPAMPKPSPGK